jgi:2-oxoglutarate ferredoxin oxidoreductase subunit delta
MSGSNGTLVIDVERCKGCELCIDACPPQVLSMSDTVNERGYRFPLLTPGCIACKACSAICPDFVFSVYRYETPVETPLLETPLLETPLLETPLPQEAQ